jgi:hypothetical protein
MKPGEMSERDFCMVYIDRLEKNRAKAPSISSVEEFSFATQYFSLSEK